MTITNDIICQSVITQLMFDYKKLISNIISCHAFSHKTTKHIGIIISEGYELTDLTILISEFENLETNIDQCIDDLGSIDISDISMPSLPIFSDISLGSTIAENYYTTYYGIISVEFVKSFNMQMKNIIINNLTYWESQATQYMFKLNNGVIQSTYDNVIEKINWVNENSCTTNETLPVESEIILWLNKYGLDEDLLVDYSQQIFTCLEMSEEIQTFFTTLLDLQEGIKTKLNTLIETYQ